MLQQLKTSMKELYKTPYLEVLYEALQSELLEASGDAERGDYPIGETFDW